MRLSPHKPLAALPALAQDAPRRRKRDDLPYQAVTVAAILMVLITLWVF